MSLSFLALLNQNNFCTFNRALAHKIGLNETIFLHAIVAKYDQFKRSHPNEEEFYYTVEDVYEATTFGEKAQSTIIKNLLQLGVIDKFAKGLPAKRHFRLHLDKIAELIGVQIIFPNSCAKAELEPAQRRINNLRDDGSHYIYKNKNKNKKESGKPPPSSPKASELAYHFVRKLKEIKPDMKAPNIDKWIKDMDLLLRRDKRNPQDVEKVIDWVVNDPFWSSNVMCPAKLREKFDKLELQMRKHTGKNENQRIKEMQVWIRQGPLVSKIQRAFSKRLVKVNADSIEFTSIYDGKVFFSHSKAEEMIEHYLGKIESKL